MIAAHHDDYLVPTGSDRQMMVAQDLLLLFRLLLYSPVHLVAQTLWYPDVVYWKGSLDAKQQQCARVHAAMHRLVPVAAFATWYLAVVESTHLHNRYSEEHSTTECQTYESETQRHRDCERHASYVDSLLHCGPAGGLAQSSTACSLAPMKIGHETFGLLLMLSWRSNWNPGPTVLTRLVEAPGCSTKPIRL